MSTERQHRVSRPTWDEYFRQQVASLASRATCDRGRSAALFVRDRDILSAGYVGSPPGMPHCDDVGHAWSDDGKHCVRTIHAEQNAVIRAARNGISVKGATLYCTMEPCLPCAMTVVGLGVVRVVAEHPYHAAHRTRDLLCAAGVELVTVNSDSLYVP